MNSATRARHGARTLLSIETLLLKTSYGAVSRLRVMLYRALGMTIGARCRLERVRIRRPSQIRMGSFNAITEGTWLWPVDDEYDGFRIDIGDYNYFNRDGMIDACGLVKIGNHNMFGPGTYITDSNHTMVPGRWVAECPMNIGKVVIGNGCWIGARVTILKDVTLGDRCIVAAGSVVTQSFPYGSLIGGNPARLVRRHEVEPS